MEIMKDATSTASTGVSTIYNCITLIIVLNQLLDQCNKVHLIMIACKNCSILE